MKWIGLLVLTFILWGLPLPAVFYQVEIYKNPQGNICCLVKDQHSTADDCLFGETQNDEFLALALEYKDRIKVLIENTYDFEKATAAPQKAREEIKIRIAQECDTLLLCYFFDTLKSLDVPMENIDDRVYTKFCYTAQLPIRYFIGEIDGMCKKLAQFNDGPALNQYYAQILKEFSDKNGPFIEYCRKNPEQSLPDITSPSLYGYSYPEFRNRELFMHMETELMNAKILHEIHVHNQTPLVLVCAGGDHIDSVSKQLVALQYSHLKTIGKEPKYCPSLNAQGNEVILHNTIFKTDELSNYLHSILGLTEQNKKQKSEQITGASQSGVKTDAETVAPTQCDQKMRSENTIEIDEQIKEAAKILETMKNSNLASEQLIQTTATHKRGTKRKR